MDKLKNSKSLDQEGPIRLPYFDWDKAKYFYYVAKLGSFSETGKFLNLSQPSLSRKISILEDHLKCKLFTRTPKGLELTRKGMELFVIVEETFLSLKGFSYNSAVSTTNNQKRKIRIATTHALASYVFCDLILDYNKSHPGLIFELIGEDHALDILLNDVDIAIRPYNPTVHGMQQEPLFTLEKKLYASSEYLEKYGEPQTVEDLKQHCIIAFGHPETHPYADINWILRLGMPEGKLHEPVFTSNSVECMIDAAKKGVGIVGSYQQMNLIKISNLKNILPDIKDKKVKWYFIYPDYLKKDKEIIELKKYLNEILFEENI